VISRFFIDRPIFASVLSIVIVIVGVVALTQSLAKEVARLNITVNALCPGFIETDTIAGMNLDERKQAQSRIPMRRFGKPEEVAAAVRFLASAEAAYITGSTLKIDGGIL